MTLLLVVNGMLYSVIQGAYVLNKAAIIENFCVNTTQPELKCDGKCYLAQQLEAEKERQEQNKTHAFGMDFGQFIAPEQVPVLHLPVFLGEGSFSSLYIERIFSIFTGALDIPPKL
ncbi:hypothetical protein A3SI_16627 [Nitritalea halalkaliphila LW7]|uniref:Uncharacterized protein n=2 Tax=Nitritalea TaxID=1187887 RepID=I5BWZ0_9BACT|nr:hypothetical protein A3SI_16627 [Nitritalea halalkaliphila LW7]